MHNTPVCLDRGSLLLFIISALTLCAVSLRTTGVSTFWSFQLWWYRLGRRQQRRRPLPTILVRPNGKKENGDREQRDPYDPSPRKGYLSIDDYFMTLAFLSGQRSKDPRKQVYQHTRVLSSGG